MSNPNKIKGSNFERRLVNEAKELGMIAKRAYASNGESLGQDETVDLMIGTYRIQAKRKKALPKWLDHDMTKVDSVVFCGDRKEPMVMITWTQYLKFIKGYT